MGRVTACPKCGQAVTAPTGAELLALVRCPLCAAEFPLREALDASPPDLELLGGSAPADYSEERSGGFAADRLDTIHEAPVYFGEAPRPPAGRRPARPILALLRMIIGFAIAGPIAVAILMWGFHKDPLRLADKLPEALVPSALRAGPR